MLATHEFLDDHLLRVGDVELRFGFPAPEPEVGRLTVAKRRELIEDYVELLARLRPARIVELGIRMGGSTVMLNELARPEQLVSIELAPEPVRALDDYIAARDLAGAVHPCYGVDQSDRERILGIARDRFAGAPLDLVVDDASHLYDESCASFEVLYPMLRPGGLFLLEDWRWEHLVADRMARADDGPAPGWRRELEDLLGATDPSEWGPPVPMSRLVLQLVLARAAYARAVDEIVVGPYWTVVRRGDAPLDPTTFRVADLFQDHFGLLAPRPGER